MHADKLIAVAIVGVALAFSFGGRVIPDRLVGDEVSQSADAWEAGVRAVYRDAVQQEFTDDKAAFEWLQERMIGVVVDATKPIRDAEGDAAPDGWSIEKARANWRRWSR